MELQIADVICEWNAFYTYARTRGEFKGNCQDFIDAILDKLGITPKFKGAMGMIKYLILTLQSKLFS